MDNLIKVGSSRFKLAEAYSFSGSVAGDIPFEDILYAAAKFGGPIAITADSSAHIRLNSSTSIILDNILIFYNNGVLARQIARSDLHKAFYEKSVPFIVGMDFLPDETLFVLSRQGIYNMIDPFTGNNKVYKLREVFYEEHIVQAKVIGKTVVFYTNQKNQLYKFYFIRDIENPVVQEFSHSEIRVSFYEGNDKPFFLQRPFFLPIHPSCSFSGKIECFVSHYKLGAYRLIEDEMDKYEFVSHIPSSTLKKLPEVKEIQYIALSPMEDPLPKKMALLSSKNVVHVIIIDSSNAINLELKVPLLKDLDPENEFEKKLFWCGISSIVITCGRFYILLTFEGEYKRLVNKSKGFLMVPELDCVRIFSQEKCEILKVVPEKYTKIFLPTSRAKAADLYNAYMENIEKNPSPENNIIEDKKGLEEGVRDILDAAYFEINPEEQKNLLNAAAFGKAFLNKSNSSFSHDYFTEVCKNLRVINALKECRIARIVTYMQFYYLDDIPRQFMEILMKYHLFYLANEIAQFLGYSRELISQIYINWACCKIEQHPNDENLPEKIFERLKNDENASYIEVAHKAFESTSATEKNRKDLALKIIKYEPSIQKKVAFLLWIDQYEPALIEASKSLDPNLIDLVILKMAKDTENGQNFWKLVSENPRTRPRLFKYIYDFRYQKVKKVHMKKKGKEPLPSEIREDMDDCLVKFASNDERMMHYFGRCFTEMYEIYEEYQDPKDKKIKTSKKIEPLAVEDKLYLLEQASKLKPRVAFTGDAVALYRTYLKEDGGNDKQEERTVYEIVKEKALGNAEGSLVKKYKMSDRVAFLAKLRALLEQHERFRPNEGIDKLIEDKNKKGDLVPFYEITNLMIEHDITDKAEKYALRIKDWDEQLFMLKYIATTTSITLAVDQALALKKYDDLFDIAKLVEQVGSNPGKYPNIAVNDNLLSKLEKGLSMRR